MSLFSFLVPNLRPASWRGVPFGLTASSARVGRRLAQHEYPFRDSVWLEDTGKLPPSFQVQGFLVSDSRIYGGGSVQGQIARMQAAAEATGQGLLSHPTRGPLQLDLLGLIINERFEDGIGAYAELEFSFIQGAAQGQPAVLSAVSGLLGQAASLADQAGLGGFGDAMSSIASGVDQVAGLADSARAWSDQVIAFGGDATALFNTVSQLGGANFGRYFNGANAGFLQGLVSPYAAAVGVEDLLAIGAQNRAAIGAAKKALDHAIVGYGVTTDAVAVGTAAQGLVGSLLAASANPADGVRAMTKLSSFTPVEAVQANPAGAALTAVLQQGAAAAAARAAGDYAPASSDDANAVRAQVIAAINVQIRAAGQSSADGVFSAFKGLRQAVFEDLGQRGASLPSLVDVLSAQALPAAVLAQRLYGDIGRRNELVTEADPVHPLFMPLAFKALAS